MIEGNDPHDGTDHPVSRPGTERRGVREKRRCERDSSVLHGRPAVYPSATRRVGGTATRPAPAAGEDLAADIRDPDSGRRGGEQ